MTEPEAHAEAAAPRQAAQRRQFSKQELAEMELETTIFNKVQAGTSARHLPTAQGATWPETMQWALCHCICT